MRPLTEKSYRTKGLDPNRLSVKDVSFLLGIYYEGALRYIHELVEAGRIRVEKDHRGQMWIDSGAVEEIRRHHRDRPTVVKFEGREASREKLGIEARQLAAVAKSLHTRAQKIVKALEIPAASSTWIGTIPGVGLRLTSYIPVIVEPQEKGFLASNADLGLEAQGRTRSEAVRALRTRIAADFFYLLQKDREEAEEERWQELQRFIRHDEKPDEEPVPVEPRPAPKRADPRQPEIAAFWKEQGLSTRAANALGYSGIASIEELRQARWKTGLKLPGLGTMSRREVERFLNTRTDETPS